MSLLLLEAQRTFGAGGSGYAAPKISLFLVDRVGISDNVTDG